MTLPDQAGYTRRRARHLGRPRGHLEGRLPGHRPDDYLANLSYEESGRRWLDRLTTDGRGVFVAEGHQDIFGFASGPPRQRFSKGQEEYEGESETVYVLPNGQGSGVGRALVAAVAEYLLGRGITSGLLWIFEENLPACSFYESLGGTVLAHDGFELGGAWVREVAYGWKDLGALLSRAASPPPSAR